MNLQTKKLCAVGLLLGLNAATAQASLIDRGNGMIFDDDRQITWLQDANYAKTSGFDSDGLMDWDVAKAWANNLVYGGYDDWRLPIAYLGNNLGASEMRHLFYSELGGVAGQSIVTTHDSDFSLFSNIQSGGYWSGSYDPLAPHLAWYFATENGVQSTLSKSHEFFAWAVRSGDVAAAPAQGNNVPEPGSLALLGLGLIALRRAKRR